MHNNLVLYCSPKMEKEHSIFIQELKQEFNIEKFEDQNSIAPIILLGGDGSLNYLVNKIKHNEKNIKTSLIYFPTGTANDFSKSLGYPPTLPTVKKVKDILRKETIIDIPIMMCNKRYFINVLTAGAPARITNSGTNLLKELTGKFSYYLQAIEEMISPSPCDISYSLDNLKEKKVQTYGFMISQGLYAGGGIKVSNSFSAHFGKKFHFVIPKGLSVSSILTDIIEIQKEEPDMESLDLDITFCEELKIDLNREVDIKLDGEDYRASQLNISKSPYSLSFYLP